MQRLNKKGQEGFSTTGLLAIVLGVIALVVLAILIYNLASKPGDVAKLLPDKFQQAVLYCESEVAFTPSDTAAYCGDYKEFKTESNFKSTLQYYNCHDLLKQSGKTVSSSCTTNEALTYCMKLAATGSLKSGTKVYISGSTCTFTGTVNTVTEFKFAGDDKIAELRERYSQFAENAGGDVSPAAP